MAPSRPTFSFNTFVRMHHNVFVSVPPMHIIRMEWLNGWFNIFMGSTVPRHRLEDLHVWQCPIYILDPQLQGGQKLPRWEPRSRRGVFMGFSNLHSSEVPLVLKLETGSITPQYHVVFDDLFSTVSSVERENEPPDNWDQLCLEITTTLIPIDEDAGNPDAPGVGLNFEWLSSKDRDFVERATTRQDAIREHMDAATSTSTTASNPVPSTVPTLAPLSSVSTQLQPPTAFPTASPDDPDAHPPLTARPSTVVSSNPTTATATVSPTNLVPTKLPAPVTSLLPIPAVQSSITSPVNVLRRSSRANRGTFSKPRYIDEAFLSSVGLTSMKSHEATLAYMAELQTCSDTSVMDVVDSCVYAAKNPRLMLTCQRFNKP